MRLRVSTLVVGAGFAVLLAVLFVLQDLLLRAHESETIHYVASDAATYFDLYERLYSLIELTDNFGLLLTGSPILFLKLAGGNLFIIQVLNLAIMAISLAVALNCLATLQGRLALSLGAIAFPYFLFGFLSLNKEVYAMCSALFYATYMVRGRTIHLLAALLLAACARYYMVMALLAAVFLVPRTGTVRWAWTLILLLFISVAAPLTKMLIPGYSGEDVLEVSGTTGLLFSRAIDAYGYALVYPLKYLVLVPLKAYGVLLGAGREGDPMEAVVSLCSLAVLLPSLYIVLVNRRASFTARRLVIAGLVAPMPIMWTEIMHWRYYSFVYFFFLMAVVMHFVEGRRSRLRTTAVPAHA